MTMKMKIDKLVTIKYRIIINNHKINNNRINNHK